MAMEFLKRHAKIFAVLGIALCAFSFFPPDASAQDFGTFNMPILNASGTITTPEDDQAYIENAYVNSVGTSCDLLDGWSGLLGCLELGLRWATQLYIGFLGWLLSLSGWILNTTIDITILNINKSGGLLENVAIVEIWKVIRNLVNIGLIFSVLYIAILTIVQANSATAKNMLGGVILAALFVNFSLTMTGFLIDVSNRITLTFHRAIIGTAESVSNNANRNLGGGIADILANELNIKTYYNSEQGPQVSGQAQYNAATSQIQSQRGRNWSILIVLIGGSLFIVQLFFTFLAIAVMLIIRYVILILLLIFSPVGLFLGVTSGMNNPWWKELWSNLLFPPALFMMLWVTIISIHTFTTTETDWTNALTEMTPESSMLFVKFLVANAMLIASLVIAKQIGARGAGQMQAWVNKRRNRAFGYVGRGILGGGLRKAKRAYEANVFRPYQASLLNAGRRSKKGPWYKRAGYTALKGVLGAANPINRVVRNTLQAGEDSRYGLSRNLSEDEVALRKEYTQARRTSEVNKSERQLAFIERSLEKLENHVVTKSKDGKIDLTMSTLSQLEKIFDKQDRGIEITAEEKRFYDELTKKTADTPTELRKTIEDTRKEREQISDEWYTAKKGGRFEGNMLNGDNVKEMVRRFDEDVKNADYNELVLGRNNTGLLTSKAFNFAANPGAYRMFQDNADIENGTLNAGRDIYRSQWGGFGRMGMVDRVRGQLNPQEFTRGIPRDGTTEFIVSESKRIASGGTGMFLTRWHLDSLAKYDRFSAGYPEYAMPAIQEMINHQASKGHTGDVFIRKKSKGNGIEVNKELLKKALKAGAITKTEAEDITEAASIADWFETRHEGSLFGDLDTSSIK